MKHSVFVSAAIIVLLFLPIFVSARHIGRPRIHHGHHHHSSSEQSIREGKVAKPNLNWERKRIRGADTLKIAGSSLPDCSHACGSCSPCRLVMVSFVCASIAEAETCPMAYRCMCHNKSYPVP
ncbi:protein EPIDERMAL PATTERNING FACTOR 1-like [Tripterygium wilfordii]|uniref:protein EPIDERMAL PATTERNING FACTOR 1-like n=1 Tax=Tripterygium wilfordii TaxID=458696 RepID=UPI0018F842B0|nr:protein EPIDERMAL PATTERNING FACTOR 1-like [Tripterygium wilfordii]